MSTAGLLVAGETIVGASSAVARRSERTQLEHSALNNAAFREAYLESEIERFRLLPVTLAGYGDIVDVMGGALRLVPGTNGACFEVELCRP